MVSLFASIQDFKKREIANWLNFSFIVFALAYRAFYASAFGEIEFFIFGILGVIEMFLIASIFYYTNAFGGGDAKLLIGFGAILPYKSYLDVIYYGLGFIFILFFIGAVYSIIYSLFLSLKNKKKFRISFSRYLEKNKTIFLYQIALFIICFFVFIFYADSIFRFLFILTFLSILFFILYVYLKAVEESSMIVLKNYNHLEAGDWLLKDVRIGSRMIRKSVHGLSREDIAFLKKKRKSVFIKEGIPFAIAFLLATLAMVFFYLFLGLQI